MLAQLLSSAAAPVVELLAGVLMMLNAVAAGWLMARPLRHGPDPAWEGEGTTA